MGRSAEAAGVPKKRNQKNSDLSHAGAKKDAAFWMKDLKKEETLNGEKQSGPFKGSEEELEAMTHWLESMNSK